MRGQANLVALVVALLLVTGGTVVAVAMADGALADADRESAERRAAHAVADRLVADAAPTTDRANVLNASRVADLNASQVDDMAPTAGRSVRVTLGNETLVRRGSVRDGTTVRRVVLVVSRPERVRLSANLSERETVPSSVPRGVERAQVTVDPGPNTTVPTVRANDRVVLHDDWGLATTATVRLAPIEPTTLRVDVEGNETGRVTVTYRPPRVEERVLEVTVDA